MRRIWCRWISHRLSSHGSEDYGTFGQVRLQGCHSPSAQGRPDEFNSREEKSFCPVRPVLQQYHHLYRNVEYNTRPVPGLMAAGLIPPEKHLQSNKSNKEFVQLNCSEIHSRSERKTTNQPAMNVYRWKKAIKPIKVNIKHDLLCQYTLWLLILFIWWLLMSFSETYFTWCLLLCHCIQVMLIIH